MGVEDVSERLSAIAEELGDLAFDRLREASASAGDGQRADASLVEEEKRLTRARRAVERALAALRGPDEAD